jgi:hypothetical protein
MIPKIEITLLAANEKGAVFNIGVELLEKEESHIFEMRFGEQASGKKMIMEFVEEKIDQMIEEFQQQTKEI